MFGISSTELILIFLVGLLVLGPEKLPQVARTVAKAMAEFRRMSYDVKHTVNKEIQRLELEKDKEAIKKELGLTEEELKKTWREVSVEEEQKKDQESQGGDAGKEAADAAGQASETNTGDSNKENDEPGPGETKKSAASGE